MRAHVFRGRFAPLALDGFVRDFDLRTREEGFRVLHSWNHREHHFTRENTPVLMLDRFAREWSAARATPRVQALLLDHYFFYVLALMVMRAWDEGDANRNLDRVTGLLRHLQGPRGSGHQFVARAETLLLMAISHFHPDESAYPRLLEKIRTLDRAHRVRFALAEAAILGSHLRWGFAVLYRRDLGRMRSDNVGDYPWLLFSVATLMEEYARLREEEYARLRKQDRARGSARKGRAKPARGAGGVAGRAAGHGAGAGRPAAEAESRADDGVGGGLAGAAGDGAAAGGGSAREGEGAECGPAWRTRVLEGLFDGLTPDPWAFTGAPPEALRPYKEEHEGFREAFAEHRDDLLEGFKRLRPGREAYSPLSFHCNFPHNAIMAKVSIQLADENAPNLPMDAMYTRAEPWRPAGSGAAADDPAGRVAEAPAGLIAGRAGARASGRPRAASGEAAARSGASQDSGDDDRRANPAAFVSANHPEALARYLMAYSGASPERLGRRGARLIIYDPNVGLRYYKMAVQAMRSAS